MKLVPVVDSLDAVPEALREAYVPADGKFVLDTDVAQHPGASGLRANNKQLQAEKQALAEKYKPFEGLDPADVTAAIEERKRVAEEKARQKGDNEEWKKQVQDGHAKELAKRDEQIARRDKALHRRVARDEARAAIVSEDGNADLLMPHVLEHVRVVERDGDWVAEVIDARGQTRYDAASGEVMSIAQLVKEMRGRDAFKSAFAGERVSGAGTRSSDGRVGTGDIVLTGEDAKDPAKYRRAKEEAAKRGIAVRFA